MDILKDLKDSALLIKNLPKGDERKIVAAFIYGLKVGAETSLANEQTAAG